MRDIPGAKRFSRLEFALPDVSATELRLDVIRLARAERTFGKANRCPDILARASSTPAQDLCNRSLVVGTSLPLQATR